MHPKFNFPFLLYSGLLFLVSCGCFLHYCFSQKKTERRLIEPWKTSWITFTAFVLGAFLSEILFGVIVREALRKFSLSLEQREVLIGVSMQLGLLIFLAVLHGSYREFFSSSINSRHLSLLKSFRRGLYQYLVTLPLILLTAIVWIQFLRWAYGRLHIPFELHPQDIVQFFLNQDKRWILSVIILFACVIAPLTEEIAFRAGLYRFLKGKLGDLPALTISSVVFAALHNHGAAFLPLCLLGMVLARTYEHFGNIRPAIFLHAIFNTNTLIMLVLEKAK